MSATCCRNFAIHRNYPFSFRPPDHVGISCFEGRQADAMIAKDARSTELSSAEGSGTPLSARRRGTGCALADRRPFDRSTAFLARRTWVSTGSAQVQNFAKAFPSRREGRIFLRPRYVSLAWSQAADQYPDLSNGVRAAASRYLHYPDAEPHITLGVTLPSPITTPVNGLGALISLIFGVNGPSRGGALAFVNASEAGVPDQPMAPLLSVTGVSPNCRRRGCVRSSLLGQVDVGDRLDVAARAFSSGYTRESRAHP
jgi:hypothetical protein